ncbi:hypothetical protein F5J12DRAFT_840248 [Pisolithus orientalis]|uniref:uncharacterized protein n=1 Tax=Pisolithus orientalis TaxID=936130 RepID=UPI0022248491|nr:uncharacterized protein F5J12DRAFT_840248 [Pisolithus orientalis]KAI6002632.1 hypothetical protein F5J12DRAFT_840248 [Pisolithus orientalis]
MCPLNPSPSRMPSHILILAFPVYLACTIVVWSSCRLLYSSPAVCSLFIRTIVICVCIGILFAL